MMSTSLTIRNLDKEVKHQLRIRAATHGRSMEAEVRDILHRALIEPESVPGKPADAEGRTPHSACDSVRGIWRGRVSTAEILTLTREA
jgi:plasmid stability protein